MPHDNRSQIGASLSRSTTQTVVNCQPEINLGNELGDDHVQVHSVQSVERGKQVRRCFAQVSGFREHLDGNEIFRAGRDGERKQSTPQRPLWELLTFEH